MKYKNKQRVANVNIFFSRKRYINSYKNKKRLLVAFLIIVNVFVWNSLINDLKLSNKRILIVSAGASVDSLETAEAYTAKQENILIDAGEETPPLVAEFSAYTSHVAQTDASPCISADNTNVCEYNGCVVATNDYEFDTILEIEGFGDCIVKDRMNKRYTGKGNIDIYFGMDQSEALKFGRKQLNYIIK